MISICDHWLGDAAVATILQDMVCTARSSSLIGAHFHPIDGVTLQVLDYLQDQSDVIGLGRYGECRVQNARQVGFRPHVV